MSMELVELQAEQLKAVVASLPANKRSGFSKAAKAACQHLRDSKANYAKAFTIACAMVENWWHLGVELQRLVPHEGGRPKNSAQGQGFRLSDLGINFKQSERCQKLAEMSKAELHEWLQGRYDEERYYLPSLRPAAESVHVANNSGEVEWYTPPEFIESARKVMGEIDLDPCSSDVAQKWIKAKRYYTADEDGLTKPWSGCVWMNPPYESSLVAEFIEKLIADVAEGDVDAAIVLVNNATETRWAQALAKASIALCFVAGRIRFWDRTGTPANSPLQGQAIYYLDTPANADLFVTEFSQYGFCAEVCE